MKKLSADLTVETIIVGTGFSGQCMAIQLDKAGMSSFILLERGDEVGGTWRDNTYPGAACDIPSHLYSFSFELNPSWTRIYPAQKEILAYLRQTAKKNNLLGRTRLNVVLKTASYDSDSCTWTVQTNESTLKCRYLILGTGGLSEPVIPNLSGIEAFKGHSFHSARWDHAYDFSGKNIAVIGTGASAIQFVPEIVEKAAQVSVFQRTPPWIIPRNDRSFSSAEKWIFKWIPGAMRLRRWVIYWVNELGALGIVIDKKYMKFAEKMAKNHLKKQVPNAELRKLLTPDYVIGCKRILISDSWYPSLQKSNVSVVTSNIDKIVAQGIVTTDGKLWPVDAIIYGTGFRATESLATMNIIGRGGISLNEEWKNGAEAYLGASVAGFPNLFLITGPNTGLGHNSMVFMIEANVHHIIGALQHLRSEKSTEIEVKREVQKSYNEKLQERLKKSVWVTGCKSWYQDRRTGKVTTLWPSFSTKYWIRARQFSAIDYSTFKHEEINKHITKSAIEANATSKLSATNN